MKKQLILILVFTAVTISSCITIKPYEDNSGQVRFRISSIKLFKQHAVSPCDSMEYFHFEKSN